MIEKYLNNRLLTLYLFPLLLGSIATLSFQPFNLTLINFVILPLFFYLIIYINQKSKSLYRKKPHKKNLFIFGTLFGFGYFLSGIHWITNSLTFDETFKILIPFGLIIIPLFLSLFFSIIISIAGPYLKMNLSSLFFFSGCLAFSDYLRAKILSGFPWNLWSYSFSWATEILQILNKFGLFAFNLISITLFMLPTVIFFKKSLRIKYLTFLALFTLLLISYLYGSHSINENQKNLSNYNEKFNIKIISPNFNLEYNLSKVEIQDRLKKLIRFSQPDKNLKTLFVWPEGVFSGYSYDEILYLKNIFSKNFSKNHFILFGVNKKSVGSEGVYNSLIIVNNQMQILQEYKKQKLVPFGEFLPLENTLNKFGFKKITEGHGSFLKGKIQNNLIVDNLNILPLICYELIFTKLTQSSHEDTNVIINISEDGWFGNSIGPYQHFAKGIFRAIENNTFVLRSANKGISAIINNKGEVIRMLNPREAGNIELEVPLLKGENKNKNDLIFFFLLFTYIFIFSFLQKNNEK